MNKLYTLSYFRKRLLSASITSQIMVKQYHENDNRYWTISMFGNRHIFCTCYKIDEDFWFEFWDGDNCIHNKRIIKTLSMKVIIESLMSWVHTNKS